VTSLVSGRLLKVLVAPGQVVRVGQSIALLTDPTAADAVTQARIALNTASASVAGTSGGSVDAGLAVTLAQQHLAALSVQAKPALTQARMDLATAEASYDTLVRGKSPAVTQARIDLDSAKVAYDSLRTASPPPTPAALAGARLAVTLANQKLEQARRVDPAALASARLAIKLAGQKLALARRLDPAAVAQAKLDLATARVTRETDRLKLDAARSTLQLARLHQRQLTVRSPVAGTVTSMFASPGAQVDPSLPIVSVADLTHLSVTINMSEFDVANIKLGDRAVVDVAALGGTSIPGTVTSIASVGVSNSGVVQFPVTVALSRTVKGLRPGMLASVQVTTAQRRGVVRVPLDAISYAGNGKPQVTMLSASGAKTTKTVTLGLAGPSLVQVVSGVTAGQRFAVVLPSNAASSSSAPGTNGVPGIGVPPASANQGNGNGSGG
jgi:RND family efflux transporter MFP subunit